MGVLTKGWRLEIIVITKGLAVRISRLYLVSGVRTLTHRPRDSENREF